MLRVIAPACFVILGPATIAAATPTIVVGTHNLQPNQADQTVQIFVTGGDSVAGVNFYVQTANGGPEAEAEGWIPPGTAILGPVVTNLDLLTATIFSNNNMGQFAGLPPGAFPQIALGGTVLNSGYVPADGLLATVTIDTTGFLSGSFALSLSLADVTTDFAGIPADITDGLINIVADPDPPANQPPSVNAGPDQTVNSNVAAQLVGSGSDPEGALITYTWVQTSGPAVTLSNPTMPNPIFTTPVVSAQTDLVFELRVSDGTDSRADTVTITVLQVGAPPVNDPDPPSDDGDPGSSDDDGNPPTDGPDGSSDDEPLVPPDTDPDDSGGESTDPTNDDQEPSTGTKTTGGLCGSGLVESVALGAVGLFLMPITGRRTRRRIRWHC